MRFAHMFELVFVSKQLKAVMHFPGVGSYQTAPGLLQPLCGKSNTDCSQIYDLSRGDAFMWLAVNRSVLYPIWIVSGYKQLKSKWCPCP